MSYLKFSIFAARQRPATAVPAALPTWVAHVLVVQNQLLPPAILITCWIIGTGTAVCGVLFFWMRLAIAG